MRQFEKTKELEATRYYQKTGGCKIFIDLEKRRNKIKVFMGSVLGIDDEGTTPPVIQMGKVECSLLCCLDNKEEIVLKTFENIYQEYANEYASLYIFGDYAPLEDWSGKIETDDKSEFKVVRYRYKKFWVDFMTVTNPSEKDNTITYVYILDKKKDFKVFCDFFDYALSEDQYEEILKRNIDGYIADFYCEASGKPYHVEGHRNNDVPHEEKVPNSEEPAVSNGWKEYLEELDETDEDLPF